MTTPIMLVIKTAGLLISIQPIEFSDDYPSVCTEVNTKYNFLHTTGELRKNSVWFALDAVQSFHKNIKELISGESASATLESISNEFSIRLWRTELEATLEVSFNQIFEGLAFSVKQHAEFDLVNRVYQQLSAFVWEISASI